MAEVAGKLGAIYYSTGFIYANTIAFVDGGGSNDTITDSAAGFGDAGFSYSDDIRVSGSTSNDGLYTIHTSGLTTNTITLTGTDSLTNESAGDWVSIYTTEPDTQMTGFFNWQLDHSCDILDVTKFEDGSTGYKKKIAVLKDWSATAEGYFQSGGSTNQSSLLTTGRIYLVRFFIRYASTPSGGDPAYYYQGAARITGVNPSSAVGEVVKKTILFEGDGALVFYSRDSAWPS